MSDDDKVREDRLGKDGAAVASGEATTYKAAASHTQSHHSHLSDMVIAFAELAGISASRVEAIARGDETTGAELDDLGPSFVEWIREVSRKR